MMKFKIYAPIVFVIIFFCTILIFSDKKVNFISNSKVEKLPTNTRDSVLAYITKNYNYSQNGENYEYTFLEFGSKGCLACRQMEEVLDEVKRRYGHKVKVVFVNLMKKENRDFSDYYGIATIPTQVLLDKKGIEFFRHNGFYSAEELKVRMNL